MQHKLEKLKQLLWGSTERKAIAANIYWLLLEKVIRYLLGFVVSVWVIRYMGPENYGVYNYAIAFTGIIGTLIGLGIEQILVRELIKFPERRDELLSNSFLLFLLSALFTLTIAILGIYLLRGEDKESFLLVSILSVGFLFKPFSVIGLYFESKVLGRILVPYVVAALVLTSLLKIWAVLDAASLYVFAGILVLEQLVYALSLVYVYHRQKLSLRFSWSFNRSLMNEMLRDSLPLMLSSFMIIIYMKIDQIMLREMVSEEEVGIYSVAVVLTSIWFIIPMVITRSFFPKIVESLQRDRMLFEQQLQKLYNVIAFIGYVVCLPFVFFGDHFVQFLYGEAFVGTGAMLALLIWTAFLMGFGIVRTAYIYAMNMSKIHLIITTIGVVVNVVLNFLLIPTYQGKGAVIATLAAQLFTCFLSNFMFKSLHENGLMMIRATIYPKIIY